MKTKKNESNSSEVEKTDIKIPWYAVGLFFLLLTIIFFWNTVSGDTFFWEDFAEYFYPAQNFAANSDVLPFWNPFTFGGMPFLADLQVGYFYPFFRMFSLFVGADGLVPASIMQNMIVLHFFIALCSMYALMRKFQVSVLGSIISAISYAFSFSLVLQAIHPMILVHLSWFPLVVKFLYSAVTFGSIRSGILGGLIFGMSVLSGHPQTLVYEGVFLAVFALWHFIYPIAKKESNLNINSKNIFIIKIIVSTMLVFVIGAGVFQIQYQHTNEFTENTLRSEMTYEKASEGSLDIKQIFMGLVPKMFGYDTGSRKPTVPFQLPTSSATGKPIIAPYYYYWETSFYFGIVAVLLSLYGFIHNHKSKHAIFFLAISIFGFLFALGSNGFLFDMLRGLPIFNKFRFPSRIMFYVTFSFTVMAGIGFDKLLIINKSKEDLIKLIISVLLVFFGTILVATGAFRPDNMNGEIDMLSNFSSRAIIFILIAISVIGVKFFNRTTYVAAGLLLIIIAFVDLLIAGGDFNESKEDYTLKYQTSPQYASFKPNYPNDLFRVSMREYDYGVMIMQRNSGMINKIMLTEGYNPLVMERYELPRPSRKERNLLWNVKYEITPDLEKKEMYFRERVDDDFLPRAWLVAQTQIVDTKKIANYMNLSNINYREVVLLEEKVNYKLPTELDSNAKVEFVKYEANKMSINVNSNSGGMLVLSEVFYPAWKAKLDGHSVKIHRANYNFRAVYVPEGKHIVEMEYDSEAYANGRLMTLIVLVFSVFGLLTTFISKKRQKKTQS